VKQALAALEQAPALVGDAPKDLAEGALLPRDPCLRPGGKPRGPGPPHRRCAGSRIGRAWANRAANLPLKSPEEALILASVVERETGVAAERPRVAAVFVNRLKLGMRLQSDPTVIYGLSDGTGALPRPLSRRDLETEHPFNTYVIAGLPPSPICNPGRAAIAAVMSPAETEDLYFVADGSGGHVFARTLDEHNRNVAKWRAIEKAAKSR
jgi:UPF0755 protein